MSIKIALVGNPNSGKTTMFNELTGSSQYVGNWPGVTVEKKEGKLKGHKDVAIMDLPGIYSLSPYTLEEVISRNYLLNEKPDVIINIIDSSNIERNLYLTTQLTELGIPVLVALNMIDIVRKNGDKIDVAKLSQELGCPLVETSAIKGLGAREAAEKALQMAGNQTEAKPQHSFSESLEAALGDIQSLIEQTVTDKKHLRFYSVKLFGRDENILTSLSLSTTTKEKIEEIIANCENEFDDDAESLITNERYLYIEKVVRQSVTKKSRAKLTKSDKIDQVVTNRWLALPIFVVVMWLVYYISVTSIGTIATDWANDGVFGDGWHLSGSAAYEESLGEYEGAQASIAAFLAAAAKQGVEVAPVQEALTAEEAEMPAAEAQAVIAAFLADTALLNISAELETEEAITTVAPADFETALAVAEPDPADFGVWVRGLPVLIGGWLAAAEASEWLTSLVLDGIVGGVGAVLGFVPQLLILFLLLSFLEDCGYMARVAFIMDRIFRRFGLSGKSFIPMLISSGCGVPGIMASRTIENEKDRKMTIILTTFIPCGAKLPIIALIAGALFPESAWVAPSAYFLGILMIIISGIILKKTRLFAGDPAPFVLELPQYHLPKARGVLTHMWERAKSFIIKAGTIIFVACGVIWFLSSFGFTDSSFGMVSAEESMLAAIGNAIAWIFIPLGFGNWQSAVATISGLVAKENVVGTFGVLFGIAEAAEDTPSLLAGIAATFTTVSALSFMAFNLLCAPCFAAIGAVRREMGSWKWTWISIGYQTALAYVVAFIIYQLGIVFVLDASFSIGTAMALLFIAAILWLLVRGGKDTKTAVGRSASAEV